MHWKTTTALICLYGIVKEFRPTTPFLTPFLVSPEKNLTLREVYSEIYPFWTYSYVVFLMPIFFLTDLLRYKPVIILEALSLSSTWALLCWGQGVPQMQLMQICFGLASAAEVSYYSYMYAVVDEKRFKTVTSFIRAAAMTGKLVAFGLAQILIWTEWGSYLLLNEISFGAVTFVFFVALLLPTVPVHSKQRHARVAATDDTAEIDEQTRAEVVRENMNKGIVNYFVTTWHSLKVYENHVVFKWSAWSAFTTCGVYQVQNYMQSLWLEMQSNPEDVANGLVEFINTLFGVFLSFGVQYLSIDWHKHGNLTLIGSSMLTGCILAVMSMCSNIIVAYVLYIVTTSIFHTLTTAASALIAEQLTAANYGLVFGINTFVAVLLQTILTFVVADSRGLHLSIRHQFMVYSTYFAMVAVGIMFFTVMSRLNEKPRRQSSTIYHRETTEDLDYIPVDCDDQEPPPYWA